MPRRVSSLDLLLPVAANSDVDLFTSTSGEVARG